MLKIPLPTVYFLTQQDKIPHRKIGGRYKFLRQEMEELLRVVRVQTPDHLYESLGDTHANKQDGGGILVLPKENHYPGLSEENQNPDIFVTDHNGPNRNTIPGLQKDFA